MTVTLHLDNASQRRLLTDLSLAVVKSKRIVVVTGAGISCSCGIPDFRSSDGLYALVKEQYPDVVLKGRELFDASLFRDSTSTAVFYTFISELKQAIDSASPAPTHRFIKTLDSKKKLLRSYTQNIDGLEERAGLLCSSSQEARTTNGKGKGKLRSKDVRNVQLHGDVHKVRCVSCAAEYPSTEEHRQYFTKGLAPDCPECHSRSQARVARSARPLRVGTLRPAIVLYDEPHPLGDDIGMIQTADLARKPDLLIIMGTSMKVHGLKKLVKEFSRAVHESPSTAATAKSTTNRTKATGKVIFVNRTAPSSEWSGIIDYHIMGDTDTWVEKVLEDWKKCRPADWQIQTKLVPSDGDVSMASPFRIAKSGTIKETKKGRAAKSVVENVPPSLAMDMVISPPPADKVPTSPSKRRKSTSHYNDKESSPSKRQTRMPKSRLQEEDRRLLFKERTNNRPGALETGDIF